MFYELNYVLITCWILWAEGSTAGLFSSRKRKHSCMMSNGIRNKNKNAELRKIKTTSLMSAIWIQHKDYDWNQLLKLAHLFRELDLQSRIVSIHFNHTVRTSSFSYHSKHVQPNFIWLCPIYQLAWLSCEQAFYASHQTHKAWRPLPGVGYNQLFFQGLLPPTPGAETDYPPLQSIRM